MQWLKSAIEAIASLFCRSPEAQVQRIKIKQAEKEDKKFWSNRYRQIFAEAEIEELELMRDLVDSNNEPQQTYIDLHDREIKVDGIKENLYQVIESSAEYDNYICFPNDYLIVRITVPAFKTFKKEFNKYGRNRIPKNYKKGKLLDE